MVKKYLALIIIAMSLCGCWNYIEVNNTRFVAGIAIDYDESIKKYIITVEAIDPVNEYGQENRGEIYTAKGNMPYDAIRNLILKTGRKFYFAHAKVLIISKQLAQKDIISMIDFAYRDDEIKNDIWLLISKEKTASEILSSGSNEYIPIDSFQISKLLMMESDNTYVGIYTTIMREFIQRLFEPNENPVLPIIEIDRNNGTNGPVINGCALFKKETFIGTLNEKETRNLLFIKDKAKRGYMIFDKYKEIGFRIMQTTTDTRVYLEDEQINIDVNIKAGISISQLADGVDYINKERFKITKDIEQLKKNELENLIKKAKNEFGIDIFDFSRYAKAQQPKLWSKVEENWDNIFTQAKVNVNVDFLIKGSEEKNSPIMINP